MTARAAPAGRYKGIQIGPEQSETEIPSQAASGRPFQGQKNKEPQLKGLW